MLYVKYTSIKKKKKAELFSEIEEEEGVNSAAQSLIESQRCDEPKAWKASDTQICDHKFR